jgi:Recombinase
MTRTVIYYLPAAATAGALGEPGEAKASVGPERPAIEGVEAVAVLGDGDGPPRSGLAGALELIAAGEAEALAVAQLRDAASSLGELVRVLAWLQDAGADLIAADVGFDSAAAGAAATVALLREVERWDREPHPARRPRGRPGLSSVDPEFAQRLALLREGGLSLGAIAAALNAEGVPTPRGGAEWRPSSVQSALGYRRPRPPVPGAPMVPPPRPLGSEPPPPPGPRPEPPPPPGPRHEPLPPPGPGPRPPRRRPERSP